MALIELLFTMFFIFPAMVLLLGVFAFFKLRGELFRFGARSTLHDLHPPPHADPGNVIEGEYTVVEEKERQ